MLFGPLVMRSLQLKNRMVMSRMTRRRLQRFPDGFDGTLKIYRSDL